ncbi:amino acid ABC transporter permease [Comamonas endophytica]|uniref:Amino acid ABC transporter permease n=1 Tax=Comamonas endophytica TaxID=2949090 RepID=A0ABY6GG36_9BURK|nr:MULTISPECIES: amino acid ABC transporter permease [unclassified Acidovorax]MCD2513404.1 amino acid ABC transporter permease [Acidovorax sp. D4N7]UYG53813.1 amino acid ABC transporter permease [Acidovorax sp. 5MLIR]
MTVADSGFFFTFFNLEVARQYWPVIASGALVTVGVGLAVVLTGVVLGLMLAIVRALGLRALSLPIIAFADIMRSLPALVVLIVLYFGLPALGLPLSAFAVTWLSLSLVLAAYAEESIWAGICAVPGGQLEAARSTGMRWTQAMRLVVLPQALRRALPPLTNRVISITKNTALGSVVALGEILNNAQGASSHAGNPTPLMMAAGAYLLVFLPLVIFSRWLEQHWQQR